MLSGGDIIAVISIGGTILTGLLTAIFHGTAMSRCKKISCCCFECDREVLQDERLYSQTKRENDDEN